jgi:outer membrane lipoprotein-sorting protein
MKRTSNLRATVILGAMAVLLAPVSAAVIAQAGSDKEPGSLSALEILEKSDDFHYGYEDAYRTVKTIVKDKDGNTSQLLYEIWEKGKKRLLVFSEPPELAGMAVLVKNEDTIYVYEPEFNKVRRIAAHAKKQSMFGMDYSTDEMATINLHKFYDPELVEEDSKKAVLMLEQKPGQDKAWPKLRVVVDKTKHWAAVNIQYMDEKGNKKKTEKRKKVKNLGGRYVTSVMIMTDHTKKHSTTLILTKCKYNQGLEDKMFTKRYLIREE